MAEKIAEAYIPIGTTGTEKAKADLNGVKKSLDGIRILLMSEAFKQAGKGIAESVLGKKAGGELAGALTGMAQGFAAAGVAGAALGAVAGLVSAKMEQAAQRGREAGEAIKKAFSDSARELDIFLSKEEARKEFAAGGGSSALAKTLQLENKEIDMQRQKVADLAAKQAEIQNAEGFFSADMDVKAFEAISDELQRATNFLTQLEERRNGVARSLAQSQLAEVKDSLFSLGMTDAERGIQSVATQYDDLLKKARLLNVSEEERVGIIAQINEQRDAAIDKAEKEAKAQDSLAGKIMGIEQFARTMQERALSPIDEKKLLRNEVLDRIRAGPALPQMESDKATDENTDATKSLTTSVEALRRGIEVAKGVRIGPGE